MQNNLVIVESPAKAKTIEKFLGKDFKVMSSFGHIRDLKKKNFGVDLNSFEPQYEIPADKEALVNQLRAEAKKASAVWLASDEDREGEAISWHLAEVLGLDPVNSRRIVFHEITKPAILDAIEHPRHIDLNLVDAQQARRVLDRLVGFKLSPVLWRKVRPNLSAGRVQSVAVRLVVEREREITNFKSEENYRVVAVFSIDGTKKRSFRAELDTRFKTKQEAADFLATCATADFRVKDIATRPVKRTPAPPFTTSTLQQEAAHKLGFPVALTMRIAQSLYEAGLITYMRTDSMNLSALCLNTCGPIIKERMGGEKYHKRRKYHTSAKGAQEAHEAIRPTDMSNDEISGTLQERRLYNLIWKRTIACQMADAELEKTTVTIEADGVQHCFIANGEVVTFDGFLKVYRETTENEGEHDTESRLLPPMKEQDILKRLGITAQQRFTQPPLRYTEASLVHKMEELGIGRPSTYAPTISTIQQREYVSRGDKEGVKYDNIILSLTEEGVKEETVQEIAGNEKGKLMPTDIGLVVNDFLMDNFPDILDYNFTASVEKEFDEVAEGKKNWTQLLRTFYKDFEPQVEKTMTVKTELKVGERELGTDPVSGQPVSVKIGRYGPMVQVGSAGSDEKPRFATLRSEQSIETITLEEALELFKLPRTLGEYERLPIVINVGRFGPYVQHNKKFVSIPKTDDPMTISLARAIELVRTKRENEEKARLKTFEEDPEMEVRDGRFGPYIACKGTNYKIPKAQAAKAAELTLEDCRKIVEAAANAPKTTRRPGRVKKATK